VFPARTEQTGRLTLNILLPFAQFEREIIVERTRTRCPWRGARVSGAAGHTRTGLRSGTARAGTGSGFADHRMGKCTGLEIVGRSWPRPVMLICMELVMVSPSGSEIALCVEGGGGIQGEDETGLFQPRSNGAPVLRFRLKGLRRVVFLLLFEA